MRKNSFWAILCLFLTISVFAGPTTKNLITVIQPDGTKISLKIFGDEFFSYRTTLDGYTVVNDIKNNIVYAKRGSDGNLAPSKIKVNNKGSRAEKEINYINSISKNIMPSEEILQKAINLRIRVNEQRVKSVEKNRLLKNTSEVKTIKLVVLLIEFPNLKHTYSKEDFEKFFNEEGFDGFGYGFEGSFKDYYKEVSNGKFIIESDIYGWYEAPNNYQYYGNNQSDYWNKVSQLAGSAIDASDPDVDYSQYDLDNNGKIDHVMVVHAGLGASQFGDTQYIWPHRNTIWSNSTGTYDGIDSYSYTMMEELNFDTWNQSSPKRIAGPGNYCHEFGHDLGLPDFYPYSGDYDNATLDDWCIMAGAAWNNVAKTPAHFGAWSKEFLGFIETEKITSSGKIEIPNFSVGDNYVVRIDLPYEPNEYFLIENRKTIGFDKYLDGEGLLIWHIDNNKSHRSTFPRKVDLEEADGDDDLANGGTSDGGDIYPGSTNNRTFNSESYPNSNTNPTGNTTNNGVNSYVSISDISDAANIMTAQISYKIIPHITTNITSGHAPLTVNFYSSADSKETVTGYNWDFDNDGSFETSSQNTTYTFTEPGVYKVQLEATDGSTSSIITKEIKVFDGTSSLSMDLNSQFKVEDNTKIALNDSFTIEFWQKLDRISEARIIDKSYILIDIKGENETEYNPNSLLLTIKDDQNDFSYWNTESNIININEWQHLSLTFDKSSGSFKIFIDENELSLTKTGAFSGSIKDNERKNLYIGNKSYLGSGINGNIDEIRLWNFARSVDEIKSDANKSLTGSESGLIGYWNLNDGKGETAQDLTQNPLTAELKSGWDFGKIMTGHILSNDHFNSVPNSFKLEQNYPNPFNPSTKIAFNLPQRSNANVLIYNVLGELTSTLFSGNLPAGSHNFNFNAGKLSSGIYFYEVKAVTVSGERFRDVKKMVLIK